ncbi:phage terminase small subunit P27 family [Puniceicoccales bacterium CK1056]|uniref:Phage terminase small subunit P27 family n=1 Tax=Oceanipulchritudo coccoides TaxID=2706888 RepID=A0A6B2M0I8_9BACT|nr:phage terminase small subunit P27 family [Oceanipulchritudo coccoides]NDV61260.1 phage terminase small subunit P27 family [Oceanipulchritudo coccoides]
MEIEERKYPLPPAPDWLPDMAQLEYVRVGEILTETLTALDVGCLCDYCTAWADFAALTEEIKATSAPAVLKSERGGFYMNPLHAGQTTAAGRMQKASERLGLDPRARKRIGIDDGWRFLTDEEINAQIPDL